MTPQFKLSEEQKELIRNNASEEMTAKELATLVNAPRVNVYQYLLLYDLPYKNRGYKRNPKEQGSTIFQVGKENWLV